MASCATLCKTVSTGRFSFKYLRVEGNTASRDGAGSEGPTQVRYRSGPGPRSKRRRGRIQSATP
ncbi:hypothetical protein CSHISOI_09488 [Colletotrichum shisoi]|uniref:Uncharacterized protein n=1 Tax=Colletotrichum shisoi TaxID=2078593 RepID=A0A5Q4BGQ2_9PEZI|nr:hypothetical protein CSHISOI_09488 [Colletotrichum shisoi]